MKINVITCWLALTLLTACHSADQAAHFAASRHLADPATAEFATMRTNTEGVTCGEVRGRDAAGKAGIFRKFIYFAHTGHLILEPETTTAQPGSDDAFVAQQELSKFEARYATDCR